MSEEVGQLVSFAVEENGSHRRDVKGKLLETREGCLV